MEIRYYDMWRGLLGGDILDLDYLALTGGALNAHSHAKRVEPRDAEGDEPQQRCRSCSGRNDAVARVDGTE